MPADTGCAKLKENRSHYEEEWFVKQLQGFVRRAAALVLAALLVFARYHVVSDKQFGGITGDLAGYFLQLCELAIPLAAVFAVRIGGVL